MNVEERLQRLLCDTPSIQYEAPSRLALLTAPRPSLSPSPTLSHSPPSRSPLTTHIPLRPVSLHSESTVTGGQLPWPQCQGNCPRSSGVCQDLNCALKSPTALFSTPPTSPLHSSSTPTPARKYLKPPSVNLTPFATLEPATSSASPEVSFSTKASGDSTRERIDFRIHQSPSCVATACSTPEVKSQVGFCGFTDVEAELNAITSRSSPPRPTINTSMNSSTPRSLPQVPLPSAMKQQRFREDPDIFTPLQYDTTYSEPGTVDSELLSELVTDTTGFTQERVARRARRAEKKEKERERGPPTHAVLYDEENRACGRVPVLFSLMPVQTEGGMAPALVAQTQPQLQPAPQVQPQSHQRSQSLRTQHLRQKMPLAYPGGPNSRPSSRESQPTAESYTTARGISPTERPQPRPPRGAPDSPPGYEGRYPSHQVERRERPLPPTPQATAAHTVPAAPVPSPAASAHKANLDALIAAQIASPHPIPGFHHSVPPRDNPWDDLFATALFGIAYSSLAREEKKQVQKTKILRGAQISASGSKGLAKIKAGEARTAIRSVKGKMKRSKEREYTQEDYEFDAEGNMYARYADLDTSYTIPTPAGSVPVAKERPASSASHKSSRSGRSARTTGRRYHEGQV